MEANLIEGLKLYVESKISPMEWRAWWNQHADDVRAGGGDLAYLEIEKRGMEGVRRVLSRNGIEFCPSDKHCQACGELLFEVMPGRTTKEEVVGFARKAKIKGAEAAARTGWLHPGQYCVNGCMYRLWNIR